MKFAFASTALGSALLLSNPAQVATAKDAVDVSGLEEIVVTAQRREQSLQSVPVAITALTAEAVQNSGVGNLGSLSMVTPGLVLTTSRASATPFIRGVGATAAGDPGGSSSVATYIDGVYLQATSSGMFSLANISRIEVIKGPQGTLFGRNATGGLIHIITPEPSQEASAKVSLGYGNYDTWTGSFYGTTGLGGEVAADLSVFATYQGEGFGKNLTLGNDINFRRETALRSKFRWTPTDETSATLTLDYSANKNDTGNSRAIAPGTIAIGPTPARGTIYDSLSNVVPNVKTVQQGISLKVSQELGFARLETITAARRVSAAPGFDQDATPISIVDAIFREKTDTLQQEVTLNGDADKLSWTAGLFYFYMSAKTDPLSIRSGAPAPFGNPAFRVDRYTNQRSKSYAVFGQATYEFVPGTRGTLGLRYSADNASITARNVSAANGFAPAGVVLSAGSQQKKFSEPTFRVALDQDLGTDMLGYVSFSRGYKAGQYNLNRFADAPVKPEILNSYELGFKSDLLERQLRVNIAVFQYQHKNLQLFKFVPGAPQLVNAAKARIRGMDIETTLVPRLDFGDLQLRWSASLLDGRYTEFPGAVFFAPQQPLTTGGNSQTTGNAAGYATTRVPKLSFSMSVDYTIPVSAGRIGLNTTYFHSSRFFFDPDHGSVQNGYGLINAQVSFTSLNEKWSAKVVGRNLGNKEYITSWARSSFGDTVAAGAPRTYGVEAVYRWGT